jgi:hypothetical protein
MVGSEMLRKWKIPEAPSGIEPSTFRLAGQCLNQVLCRVFSYIICITKFTCLRRHWGNLNQFRNSTLTRPEHTSEALVFVRFDFRLLQEERACYTEVRVNCVSFSGLTRVLRDKCAFLSTDVFLQHNSTLIKFTAELKLIRRGIFFYITSVVI